MLDKAVAVGLITSQMGITADNSREVFDYSYTDMMEDLYPNNPDKRIGDLVCDTVYERLLLVRRPNNGNYHNNDDDEL